MGAIYFLLSAQRDQSVLEPRCLSSNSLFLFLQREVTRSIAILPLAGMLVRDMFLRFRLCSSSAIVWVDGVSTCSYRFVTSTPGMTNVDIVVFQIRTYTNFFLGFRSHNKTNFDDHIFFMYFFLQKMAKKYTKL